MLQRRLQGLSLLIVLIIVINGCGDTTSKKHIRYEWKTVMKAIGARTYMMFTL